MRWKTTERRIDELEDAIGGIGHVIQENEVSFTHRPNLNFIGSGATVTDNLINDSTDIYVNEIPLSNNYGLHAQIEQCTPIVPSSGEASLIGLGVGTLEVPRDVFQVGDSFVVKMCGKITCANAEVLHIHVLSNGIIILNVLAYTMPKCSDKYWDLILDFTVTKIGIAGTAELFANGTFTYNKDAATSIDGLHFGEIGNTTFDTTVSNTLDITAEWITAHRSNVIQSQNFVLNKTF
jgi:hypothetical protein